jgi:acetyl-CoA synthetase
LFTQFGPDAVEHRLTDSGASVVFTDARGLEVLTSLSAKLPALKHIIVIANDTQVCICNTNTVARAVGVELEKC